MPTLQELIAFDAEQGKAKLGTLQLVFAATLARLPHLQQEIQGWLDQDTQGVDFIGLAEWAEPVLLAATDWLLTYDRLPAEVRQVAGMQTFMRKACEGMGAATAGSMIEEFERVQTDAQEQVERESKRLAAEEAQRQAEKARARHLEALARQEAKERAIRERLEAEERQRQAEKERLEAQARWNAHQARLNAATPEMVATPAGEQQFTMGVGFFERFIFSFADESPARAVNIKPFEIGKYPVTRRQWKAVMGEFPDSDTDQGVPVSNVSWDDVQSYIRELNRLTGKNYRLPSEAEWEYAARAGGKFTYSGGNDPDKVAWYVKNSGKRRQPVGIKQPNAFGLYDMSGNVLEWVQDRYHDSYRGAPSDQAAWVTGDSNLRVLRGGDWKTGTAYLHVTCRFRVAQEDRGGHIGFRLARTIG